MSNINEKRFAERYYISEYIDSDYFSEIVIEINADRAYYPEIVDISINGIGFFLKETDETGSLDNFNNMETCFLNMQFQERSILTEGKRIWSIIVEEHGGRILKGGFSFSVMSPDNRLLLAGFLKSLRNKK
ncbi:MAG: hypothetical protein JW864_17570 [Spirochaetes bacterium]|nr:hypothetical protein [Spirochaetota bacterium]